MKEKNDWVLKQERHIDKIEKHLVIIGELQNYYVREVTSLEEQIRKKTKAK